MDYSDKPLVVSGGSKGLGLAIVTRYLERGCPVGSFARSQTPETQALQQKYPDQFHFETVDAGETDRVDEFIERFVARFGRVHGLVNNAAIGQDHLLAHISRSAIDSILAVNLRAPILLTRSIVRRMLLGANGGRIVNITSICGIRGYAGLTVYSATKGAMEAFTRSLAREVGSRNILVNAIAPGFFASAMSSVLATNQLEIIRRRTPTERLCTERDILPVLDVLLFESTNMTGQTVYVDGGSSV
jgi:3-oxoacyl-[acyl-carrier protein] reductase